MADPANPDPAPSGGLSEDELTAELMKMGMISDAPAAATPAPASTSGSIGPDLNELEELLKQASLESEASMAAASAGKSSASNADADLADRLMAEAHGAAAKPLPATQSFDLPSLEAAVSNAQSSNIDLLRDVDLNVKIELGRSRMLVEDVLKLAEGSVVELDKLAGDPVDVFVNDRLVARGEVLVLNDNFCVRVNEIVAAVRDEP
ncbi:MAG: flagellar motor switch protein FliN [Tepidisphaeraceae bacterium]